MTSKTFNYPALSEFFRVNQDRDFVVVGAARGGWYAIRVLRDLGLEPVCVSDLNAGDGQQLLDVPVYTHEKTFSDYPDAAFVVALLEPDAAKRAQDSIIENYDCGAPAALMDEIIHYFMTVIGNRSVDADKYWEALQLYREKSSGQVTVSPTLSYVMTEKCTLNCEHCGAFVPDIDDPETFEIASIVSDIERYCAAFDVVHHIALQGGEPFLHKGLNRVVEAVAGISNLLFIDIVTNGTIDPKDSSMQVIAGAGVTIVMSDYGEHSPKKEELIANCSRNKVFLDYHLYTDRLWGAQFPIEKRNRSPKDNVRTYRECISDVYLCCQLMDGQLHRCSFSNFTNRLGYIPNFPGDYVDLNSTPEDQLGEEIRKVALRKGPLKACDYCPGSERDSVPAGLQLPRKKKQRRTERQRA